MGFLRRTEGEKPAVEPELPFPQRVEQPVQERTVAAANIASPPASKPASAATPAKGSGRKRLIERLSWKLRWGAYTATAGALGCALWLGAMLIYYTVVFPNPLAVRAKERAPIIRIVARDGTLLADRGAAHDYMPVDMLPDHVVDAVVATEDRRFFQHWGVDPAGLMRAAFANLRAGRYVQGGSTLTQQLAKNLFLTSERTVSRKLDELALAVWLEVRLTKREILELYLNRVYFGGGAYGIEAAAQRYFDKSARALSIAEAALIAGLLKAPSKYSPTSNRAAALARSRSVLAKMRDAGVITKEAYTRALGENVKFANFKETRQATGFEYAIDLILEKLPPLLGDEHAELVIETTIDAALQRRANELVESYLAGKGKSMKASQAALLTLDDEGGIRALVGGRSFAESQFNRATKARRQPGSVFKPFVYLTALERGMKPDTITYDLPLTIDGWTPRNDNNQHVGALTLRQALAQSVNTVAVRLSTEMGLANVSETAHRLGIQSELREDPSMALGTSELTLMELTGAYNVFSRGGTYIEPHIIRRLRLNTGRVLYARAAPTEKRVVALENVGALNDMLNAALVAGTGRRAALPHQPAAGKTGTTQDYRDAWFIGYTAHMTTGIWLGNDDGTPMRQVMGGNLPAEIWHDVMVTAHRGRTPSALPGTAPMDAIAARASDTPPIARTSEPETLPWRAKREPATSAMLARQQPRSRSLAAVRARKSAPTSAPIPTRPSSATVVVGKTQRQTRPTIGQRLIVEPPKAIAVAPPRRATHPTERISEEFMARALGLAPPAEEVARAGFDPAAIQRRLDALPSSAATTPRGMMSLGAGN